jgi:acyl dehydratase
LVSQKYNILTPEALAFKGHESPIATYEVTEEAVRGYAQALEHPHPHYLDMKKGKEGPYGTLIAPPTFIHHAFSYAIGEDSRYSVVPRDPLNYALIEGLNFEVELYGGTEIDLHEPIRVGDVLTIRNRIVDLYEREGRSGSLAFCVYESTFTNQHGRLAAKERYTYIYRK